VHRLADLQIQAGTVPHAVSLAPGSRRTGVMSWVCMLHVNGRQIHKTLGRLGDMPLVADAVRGRIPLFSVIWLMYGMCSSH